MHHDVPALLAIIHDLESKLKCLTDHHRQCARGRRFTPPPDAEESPPPDVEESPPPDAEESPPPDAEESPPPDAEESPPPDVEESSPPDLKDWFVPYEPQEYSPVRSRLPKPRKQVVCRWKSSADDLCQTIPSMEELMTLRDSKDNGESRIKAILGGVSVHESKPLSRSSQSPLKALESYAEIIKGSEDVAKFAAKVHAFQELIFVSACEVLVFAGYEIDSVNDAMRLYLTNAQDAHLCRLRKGARWVAELISTLDTEWEHSMTEYIFNCKSNDIYFPREL